MHATSSLVTPIRTSPRLENGSGASAALEAERLVVRDARGRLLFSHGPDGSTVHVRGDVALAVDGRLALSGREVSVRAGDETLELDETRGTRLRTRRLDVGTGEAQLVGETARVAFAAFEGVVESATRTFGKLETHAGRIVERARETYRDATDVAHLTAGRVRVIAHGSYDVLSERARIKTDRELSLDGEKIRLG